MRQTITALAILLACASAQAQSLFSFNVREAARRVASSGSTIPSPSTLKLWWEFSAASFPLADSSGNSNTGVQTDTSKQPTVASGYADFDGSADYCTIGTTPQLLDGTGAYTVGVWLKPDVTSSLRSAFATYDSTYGATRMWDAGGTSAVWRHLNTTSVTIGALSTTAWHHFAVTFNGATTQFRTYYDGAFVGETSSGWSALVMSQDWRIGANESLSLFYNGKMDELTIYTSVLTGAEIATLYTVTNKGKR